MWQIANRCARHGRPLVVRVGQRTYWSRRNIPVTPPWRGGSFWHDMFKGGPRPESFWRDFEHNMGRMGRNVEQWMAPRSAGPWCYVRPGTAAEAAARSEVAQVKYDSKSYEVKIDVPYYSPEELNVKLEESRLIITGKHEQRADEHGYVSREFHREFLVPEDVDLDSLTSSFTEDGVLFMRADVKGAEKTAEKIIKIHMEPKPKSSDSDKS